MPDTIALGEAVITAAIANVRRKPGKNLRRDKDGLPEARLSIFAAAGGHLVAFQANTRIWETHRALNEIAISSASMTIAEGAIT